MFEEIKRGTLADLADWAADGVRGEIVLVIGGASAATLTLEDGLVQVQRLVADGMRLKEASTQVAEETGLSKRELYQAALAAK
jgi:16S rRNA (cytidine1402-2'-O)-methyltransferase